VTASKGLRVGVAFVTACLGILCMAPTPGDVGGCGREPELLDERGYAEGRRATDCARCTECSLTSARCGRACSTESAAEFAFPPGCAPLLRDGEVCIRALRVASCESYAAYLSDTAPQVPTECQFCLGQFPKADPGPLLGAEAGK
jgi:hypothetical protein